MDARGQMMELQAQVEQLKSQMAEQVAAMAAAMQGGGGNGTSDGLGLPVGDAGDGCFIVRWCEGADGEATGQWEMLLPHGCFAVGESCEVLNRPASETTGHEDEEDWYKINIDESVGSQLSRSGYGEDGNETTISYRRWDLVVHAKTSAKKYGVDALDSSAKRYIYVSAVPYFEQGEETAAAKLRRWKDELGDEFSRVVARAYVENAGGTMRRAEHTTTNAVNVAAAARGNFQLVWYFDLDASNELVAEKVYCVANTLSAAGMVLKGDDMIDVSAAKEIEGLDPEGARWAHSIKAKIRTNSENMEENIVEVEVDPQPAARDDFTTWLALYDIMWNGKMTDYRASSLTNVQIYR